MTYGEACIKEQQSMELKNGKWEKTIYIDNKPRPMSKEDAGIYYNTKLFNYWIKHISDEIPKSKRENYLKMRMFGRPTYAKLLEN